MNQKKERRIQVLPLTNNQNEKIHTMKNQNLTIALIWLTAIGLSLMLFYSCKDQQVIYKTETKYISDTLIINGDTIIRYIECPECPECKPKTRLETRLEYRLDKKALRVMKSMYEDSLKEARKINAANNERIKYVTKWKTKEVVKVAKTESKKVWNWLWIGLSIGVISAVVIRLIWKRL